MNLNGKEFNEVADTSEVAVYLSRVFGWMCLGLLLTGSMGFIVAATPALYEIFLGSGVALIGITVATFGLVIAINRSVQTASPSMSTFLFLLFSVVNGLTFSIYFIAFDLGDMALAFMLTAGIFASMSLIGFVTKRDLTKFGSMLMIALIGMIVAMVVNMFLGNPMLDVAISGAIVLLFMGMVVYDVKKIKEIYYQHATNEEALANIAIWGALSLYLDVLNLFIHLLRIIARIRD